VATVSRNRQVWTAVRTPGPLRAFYQRVRARRGVQVAALATARKLATLCWCLLTREQDYAFAQPTLTRKKIRRLELAAGAPSRKGQVPAGQGLRNKAAACRWSRSSAKAQAGATSRGCSKPADELMR
jgi:transposase